MSRTQAEASHGFDQFELCSVLERNIEAAGYDQPRPIQLQTIPAALDGRDILGLAQTGTGKTAAFALPILDELLSTKQRRWSRVLVLAPTRELAVQIDSEFQKLAKGTRIRTVVIYGGVSERNQIQKLRRNPEVIVACPGRLLDLLKRGEVHLDRIDTLVLDEADHMFDMGFLPDIRRILRAIPEDRQTLLFGATMPREIRKLAERILYDPFVVELAHTAPAKTIDHALYPVHEKRKQALLEHFLSQEDFTSAIVFTRTKFRAKRLAQKLDRAGHRTVALQGNMSQPQRDRAMQGFRDGTYDILVATDIAARGIDVASVSHVINYDIPNTPEAYTHRIGRTGRSERSGRAFTFVTDDDRAIIKAIERMIGQRIPVESVPEFEEVAPNRRRGRDGNSRGGGQSQERRETSSKRRRRRRPRGSGAGIRAADSSRASNERTTTAAKRRRSGGSGSNSSARSGNKSSRPRRGRGRRARGSRD